jgi:uncharacterized membrane protein SirB2
MFSALVPDPEEKIAMFVIREALKMNNHAQEKRKCAVISYF